MKIRDNSFETIFTIPPLALLEDVEPWPSAEQDQSYVSIQGTQNLLYFKLESTRQSPYTPPPVTG